MTGFRIEVDIVEFTAQLLADKLEKAINATSKVLSQKASSFINMQSLVRFFSMYSQVVRLGCVFIRKLWDCVNFYSRDKSQIIQKKISAWVKEDLEW